MSFHAVFNDYALIELPAIPADWVDESWINDACPSFAANGETLHIYVDYQDAARREYPDCARFIVLDVNGCDLLVTDDWEAVLALVLELAS